MLAVDAMRSYVIQATAIHVPKSQIKPEKQLYLSISFAVLAFLT